MQEFASNILLPVFSLSSLLNLYKWTCRELPLVMLIPVQFASSLHIMPCCFETLLYLVLSFLICLGVVFFWAVAMAGKCSTDDRRNANYALAHDHYDSVEQVIEALQKVGLESCNLIVGVDFTKSNEWAGGRSFNAPCLHDINGSTQNPYEQAIRIIGETLSVLDEDGKIPFFGFGDASTHDHDVFSFYPDQRPCDGISEGLARYREIVPLLTFSGPTSFAPIVETAIDIVKRSGYYHILLIVTDGQVAGANGTGSGCLSFQEQRTTEALVNASWFPLSIILVGVGDGPWDLMKRYVNCLPARRFDNFQFVNFTEMMSKHMPQERKKAQFALEALQKIPSQYKATTNLDINDQVVTTPRMPRPPPLGSSSMAFSDTDTSWSSSRPRYQNYSTQCA